MLNGGYTRWGRSIGAELFGLLALMTINRPNANLDQAFGGAFLHNARKWASMRKPVALEFVVEIWMSVEVEDRQSGNVLAEGADDGQSNGVVSPETHWTHALVEQLADLALDGVEWLRKCKFQIAGVAVGAFSVQVDAGFRPRIR